jgi:AraC family ethanolamine operon transcriptional activator
MQSSFPPIKVHSAPRFHGAPPGPCGRVFDDIDEQAASLSGWNQRYLQLSAGRFRGSVQRLNIGNIGLFIEDLQQTVHQTGQVRPDVVALGIPLHFSGDSRFCGKPGSAAELHMFSGADGFEFHSPKRHVMLGIEISRPDFEDLFDEGATVQAPSLCLRAGLHAVDQGATDCLRAFGLALLKSNDFESDAASDHSRTQDALLEKLLAVLDAPLRANRHGGKDVPSQPLALERRARDLVMARLEQPPSVAEMCGLLGVSRRTLQNCIQATWGMGPLA